MDMSPFGIFTIVLISLYAVYYAVLITRDIYGQKKTVKNEEEEFDVTSLQVEDAAVNVEESENGFSLNSSRRNDEVAKTTSSVSSGVVGHDMVTDREKSFCEKTVHDSPVSFAPSTSSSFVAATNSAESTTSCESGDTITDKKIDKIQEEMDEIAPVGNLAMSKEFFRDLLLQANKEGSLFVQKKHVPAV